MRHYAYFSLSLFLTQQHHGMEIPLGQLVTQQLYIFLLNSRVVFPSANGLGLVLVPPTNIHSVLFICFAATSNDATTDHSMPCP